MNLKVDLSPFITASGHVSQRRDEYPEVESGTIEVWLYAQDHGFQSDAYDITDKMGFEDIKRIEALLVEKFLGQTMMFDDDDGDAAYDWAKAEGTL